MLIKGITNAGAMPTLELSLQFAARRHELIAHNISNFTTPHFQPRDADPREFQGMLSDAIGARRRATGGMVGELTWRETRQVHRSDNGRLALNPQTPSGNILFHDRNNRDLERTMQDLVENQGFFRATAELIRSRTAAIRGAIAERV